MKYKVLFIAMAYIITGIVTAACERNEIYELNIADVHLKAHYEENAQIYSPEVVIQVNGALKKISDASYPQVFNSAYASSKPMHTYHMKNRPQSVQIFSEMEVDSLWQAGEEINHMFYVSLYEGYSNENFEMDNFIQSSIKSQGYINNYGILSYRRDLDAQKPGYRQFRFRAVLEDGTVCEQLLPKFYITE